MSTAKITLIGMYNYDNNLFDPMILPSGIDKNLVVDTIIMHGGEFEILYSNPSIMKRMIGVWSDKWYRTFSEWLKGTKAEWNPVYNYDRFEDISDESKKTSDSKTTADYTDTRTADLTEKRTADLTDKRTAALQDETTTGSSEKVSNVGTDTTTQAVKSTTEHMVSAYDSSSYQPSSMDIIDNGTNSVAHNSDVTNVKDGSEVNKHTGFDIMDHTGTDETATTGTDTYSKLGTLADTSGSEQNTNKHTAHMYGNIGVTTSAAMLKEFYDIALWNLYEHISDVFISELLIPVY